MRAGLICLLFITITAAEAKKPKPPVYHECLQQACFDDLRFVNEYSGIVLYTSKLVGNFQNNTNTDLRDVTLRFVNYYKGAVSGDAMCVTSIVPAHSSWRFEALPMPSGMRVDSAAAPTMIEVTGPDGRRYSQTVSMKKACNKAFRDKYCNQ